MVDGDWPLLRWRSVAELTLVEKRLMVGGDWPFLDGSDWPFLDGGDSAAELPLLFAD